MIPFLPRFTTPRRPDQRYIRELFDGLAPRYDRLNEWISLGQVRRLRLEAAQIVKEGMRVLDLGCGTGDLALLALEKAGPQGEVVGLDFSPKMLEIAQKRYEALQRHSGCPLKLVLKKAEELPLEGGAFDAVLSGFTLRNFYENLDAILEGVLKSLKTGGRIAFLDLTEPENPVLAKGWEVYFTLFAGFCGALLFGNKYPLHYLAESGKRFFKKSAFTEVLEKAGFRNVRARSFCLGGIALYEASK